MRMFHGSTIGIVGLALAALITIAGCGDVRFTAESKFTAASSSPEIIAGGAEAPNPAQRLTGLHTREAESQENIAPRTVTPGRRICPAEGCAPPRVFPIVTCGYQFTTLDFPGATRTITNGLNTTGTIVGSFNVGSGPSHGLMLQNGGFTQLDVPGALNTFIVGVNDRGQMSGFYNTSSSAGFHGFLLSDSQFTTIDFPGATSTEAMKINSFGEITGLYVDSAGAGHGYTLSDGTLTSFDIPGAASTFGAGINAAGDTSGDYYDGNGGDFGFLLTKQGLFTEINFPGSVATVPEALDDLEEVSGLYQTATNEVHGFVWRAGVFFTLDPPGSVDTRIRGSNAEGELVGRFTDSTGVIHGFLAALSCGAGS